jgi:DNA-directed RNA polymerase subunit RPC12/RpoP
MVTNNPAVVCPNCRQVNGYEIKSLQLIDTDLHVSYLCETCGTEYTDIYALVYLGGHMPNSSYDRDNITAKEATLVAV